MEKRENVLAGIMLAIIIIGMLAIFGIIGGIEQNLIDFRNAVKLLLVLGAAIVISVFVLARLERDEEYI